MPPLFSRPSVPHARTTTTYRSRAYVPARPWIPNPDDDAPQSAVPYALAESCDVCPAAARTLFTGVAVTVPDGWAVYQANVGELHLCGHHATATEAALEAGGWMAVVDTRSRIAG
jgi:hypothetical protein